MEINFNPAIRANKTDPVDYQLKKKLEELGIQPTGSKESDLQAIKEATGKSGTDSTDKITQAPQTPPEIAAFMRGIGVNPTNSKESDAIAVSNRLNQLETQAAKKSDITLAQGLKAEWAQLTASAPSEGAGSQQSGSGDSFAGQNQMAKINKHFLIK